MFSNTQAKYEDSTEMIDGYKDLLVLLALPSEFSKIDTTMVMAGNIFYLNNTLYEIIINIFFENVKYLSKLCDRVGESLKKLQNYNSDIFTDSDEENSPLKSRKVRKLRSKSYSVDLPTQAANQILDSPGKTRVVFKSPDSSRDHDSISNARSQKYNNVKDLIEFLNERSFLVNYSPSTMCYSLLNLPTQNSQCQPKQVDLSAIFKTYLCSPEEILSSYFKNLHNWILRNPLSKIRIQNSQVSVGNTHNERTVENRRGKAARKKLSNRVDIRNPYNSRVNLRNPRNKRPIENKHNDRILPNPHYGRVVQNPHIDGAFRDIQINGDLRNYLNRVVHIPRVGVIRNAHIDEALRNQHIDMDFRNSHNDMNFQNSHIDMDFQNSHIDMDFQNSHIGRDFRNPHNATAIRRPISEPVQNPLYRSVQNQTNLRIPNSLSEENSDSLDGSPLSSRSNPFFEVHIYIHHPNTYSRETQNTDSRGIQSSPSSAIQNSVSSSIQRNSSSAIQNIVSSSIQNSLGSSIQSRPSSAIQNSVCSSIQSRPSCGIQNSLRSSIQSRPSSAIQNSVNSSILDSLITELENILNSEIQSPPSSAIENSIRSGILDSLISDLENIIYSEIQRLLRAVQNRFSEGIRNRCSSGIRNRFSSGIQNPLNSSVQSLINCEIQTPIGSLVIHHPLSIIHTDIIVIDTFAKALQLLFDIEIRNPPWKKIWNPPNSNVLPGNKNSVKESKQFKENRESDSENQPSARERLKQIMKEFKELVALFLSFSKIFSELNAKRNNVWNRNMRALPGAIREAFELNKRIRNLLQDSSMWELSREEASWLKTDIKDALDLFMVIAGTLSILHRQGCFIFSL